MEKPSQSVKPAAPLRVRGELTPYVSRGAQKLKKALEVFSIDLKDKVCLDVGASTGGFTDVMLRAGAACVYAVDVGYNSWIIVCVRILAWSLWSGRTRAI